MPSRVSGKAGYNFYLSTDGGTTFTKQNNTPLPDLGPFTFSNLTPNTPYGTNSLYWTAVDNDGNESAKHAFVGAQYATLNPTPATSPMNTTDSAAIDAIVAKCIAAGAGPGVTIGITSPKGYKTASYGSGTGNNLHYLTASQTKTFTGTAVLRAVDAGHISLSAKLSTYLPGYPTGAADPTIQQMMMMQSGIYDYELANTGGFFGLGLIGLGEEFTLNPTMAYTVDQIIAIIKGGGSMFTPGTKYYYTNSNYYVLAKVVESVDPTHRTIDQIIAQDILTPLGMVNTSFRLNTGPPPSPYAKGYDDNPIEAIFGIVQQQDVSSQNPSFIWAAGAIDSMVSDMLLWGKELRDGTLLSPTTRNLRMSTFAQQPNAGAARFGLNFDGPPTFGYGLGYLNVGSWFGHDGSWLGYDSCTMALPINGTVITVYENFQTTAPHVLASLTTIWYQIAEYLYPTSAQQPGYLSGSASAGGIATAFQKMQTQINTGVLAVGEFHPFTETNVAQTNQPIPANATNCYVTLIAQGGKGGLGGGNINQSGGSGGGGGGRLNRTKIPVSLLGPNYSTTIGPNPEFQSGTIDLKALVGHNGVATATYNASVDGGVGGSWSATPGTINGVVVTGVNGQQGGGSSMYSGVVGGSDTVNDGAAGGGGGGGNQNGGYPGAKGGDSLTQTGGAAGAPGLPPTDATAPHGGAGGGGGSGAPAYGYNGQPGGAGGFPGGGGGGGGCTWGGGAGAGGDGGGCLVLVEWE